MDNYTAAIGRECGKVDTDSGGLARYSLKIQVPPGLGGIQPELSLEYSQGCPNGSLGLGWALGGLSCIRKGPSNLAFDDANTPPTDYDRFQPKLNLDGVELLNVKGRYFEQDAEYTTEVDSAWTTITPFGTGFLLRDATGVRKEYGTTDDSRVLTAAGELREWRLKKQSDRHGNSLTYTYVSSPAAGRDMHACYLSEVRYGSNETTGHAATRIVQLEYCARQDIVVQTAQGDKAVWGCLLSAIRIGTLRASDVRVDRSYELGYTRSGSSEDSCLTSVTETAGTGEDKIQLLPSIFAYTSCGVTKDWFKQDKVTSLRATTNNVAVLTLNISGRSLVDVACVRYNPSSKVMSIKTYLANRERDGSISWSESDGAGAEATLPLIDSSRGFPNILAPDLNGDGRSDLIIPHSDHEGMVRFSLSQSLGTGFQNHRTKATRHKWTDGSRFLAVDLTGRGSIDVVQIFTEQQKLAFRNFPSVTENGEMTLRDAKLTITNYENIGTIDWFTLTHIKTGAMSLVRVWAKDIGRGLCRIAATTFTAAKSTDSTAGFVEGKTSVLETSVRSGEIKYNVIPCDINGDGTQDIVLATAEYRGSRMALTYATFLGDGQGGFEKHDDTVAREIVAPVPLDNRGQFHTTNLNGSNYPSLTYVYQERNSRSYTCLSVDGRSNGLVGQVTSQRVAGDMPSSKMDIVATDLNGNGMGDWLFHTIENDQPRLVPVYNRAESADLLSWTRNPMGLRTDLTYGALSDPEVYTPWVSWKGYRNDSKDSYVVLGAPNYVVRGLEHRNDESINRFSYAVSIKKSYSAAIVNTKGRGWQGFGEVHTLNAIDKILTTEKYLQKWPLTSQKSQIDTKTADGKILKSEKTAFEIVTTSRGPWKIYRANRTLEQTDMLEGDVVARSSAITSSYNKDGYVTSQYMMESVQGQLAHQAWQRFDYTAINGIRGLLTRRKTSSKEQNTDMTTFQEGDASLTHFEYETSRAVVKSASDWSTDVNAFAVKRMRFDEYGNEIESIDAGGLKKATTYDDVFKSFPVKVTTEGAGVSTIYQAAFDEASGQEAVKLQEDGSLIAYRFDPFGRIIETRSRSAGQGTMSAKQFLGQFVAEKSFSNLLSTCCLDPCRALTFERVKGASASMSNRVLSYSREGIQGQSELVEFVDCVGQTRQRYKQNANEQEKTWMAWEYDTCGRRVFEAFPTKSVSGPQSLGTKAKFDILGRPVMQVRPSHGKGFIVVSYTYLDGGAKIQERTLSASTESLQDTTERAMVEKRIIRVGDKDLTTEMINENGLRSTFQYDTVGNMILATDPAGNQERRTYNAQGKLVTLKSSRLEVSHKYNIAGHLVSQSNAAGEVITYTRDAAGRPLTKTGQDGRTIAYTYGMDKPSSVVVKGKTSVESRFDFTYDHEGRLKDRKVTVDGVSYTTSLTYDWQGQVVKKAFSDGVTLVNEYNGTLVKSTTLTSPAWSLGASFAYGAVEKAERIRVGGTGTREFEHEWSHDAQGFPLSHSLRSGATKLVEERYAYNDLDQMIRRNELVSGMTREYSYDGRRLASSQNSYTYDKAGNLLRNCGMDIKHTPGRTIGTRDGAAVLDISYDAAGRMTQRTTEQSTFRFVYDGFGALKSLRDNDNSLEITTDFDGETLQRKYSDGSTDILIGRDFSIHIQADGSQVVRHKLFGQHLLGTVSTKANHRAVHVPFADTKGNVTHMYNGDDVSLREKLDYDDFGAVSTSQATEKDGSSTYEGKSLDQLTGLLDFGGRWYDPLVGRFTTPDDIDETELLMRTDGLNRYAFENNDPINNIDPTGHWSWSSILGVVIGAAMILGAVAITVATMGAGGVLLAAVAGGLAAGGVAGVQYSIQHHDEKDTAKFWGGFGTTVAINTAIGAAAGALGAVATPAKALSGMARLTTKAGLGSIAAKALIGGAVSVLKTATERGVSNTFYGTDHNMFEGAGLNFATGAGVGAVVGFFTLGGTSNPLRDPFKLGSTIKSMPSVARHIMKEGSKEIGKKSVPLVVWGYKYSGLDKEVNAALKNYQDVQSQIYTRISF